MRMTLCCCLLAGLFACSGKEKATGKRRPPVPVRTHIVQRAPFVRALALTGEVYAPRSVTLAANVEGLISCCFWREGDELRETDEVFTIDRAVYKREVDIARQGYYVAAARHADLQAGYRPEEIRKFEQEVLAAREKLDFATKDRDRAKKLYEGGSVSRETYEKAELEYVSSKTRLETAENQLKIGRQGATRTQLAVSQAAELEAHARLQLARSRDAETRVVAPFSGTITKVHARPGDNASPRGPLVDLVDLGQLVVRFSVPENQAAAVNTKQKVLVSLDAHPGRELEGVIERVHPTLDPRTRVLWVEARLYTDVRLIPGMFARVRLVLEELAEQVVLPESAMIQQGNERFVFLVEGGKALRRVVKIGHTTNGLVQIVSGLEAGALVIPDGADQLRDGQDVEVISKEPGDERPGPVGNPPRAAAPSPMKE